MIELECIVRGKVQMVMFRDFAERNARTLGLKGAVRNMADGTVHVRAQGEEEALLQLLRRLSKGPMFADVDTMSVRWHEPTTAYERFSIVYD